MNESKDREAKSFTKHIESLKTGGKSPKLRKTKNSSEGWGVGDQADAPAFDTVPEGELIFGQYPHSRMDNNIYLRRPSGDIVAFDGHRRLIDIDIKSSNYLKDSYYSGDEIRKSCIGKVMVDGVQLIEEFGREPLDMMRHLEELIREYQWHSSNWFSKQARAEMPGRRIYYYQQPATVKRLVEDQGCIIIETEPGFVPPKYDVEEDMYDYWEDWKVDGHYEVKDEVLSPHIWWWRK